MDTKKLVSWIRKNWYHGYEKIGIMDTKKLVAIMDTKKLVSLVRKSWYHGYKINYLYHEYEKIGIMNT